MPYHPSQMPTPTIPIALCSDRHYFAHLATTVVSLLETNRVITGDIHLLVNNVPTETIKLFRSHVHSTYGAEIKVIPVPDSAMEGIGVSGHWTLGTYLKLFLGEFLPQHLDKVLFLDSDVIVVGDLKDLLSRAETLAESRVQMLAAVPEAGSGTHLRRWGFSSTTYFNAGVMLIDLNAWRDQGIGSHLQDIARSMQGQLPVHDQDVLNLVLENQWIVLPNEFNELRKLAIRPESKIVHFASADKPWKTGNRHPARAQYKRFRDKTPFPYKTEFDPQNLYRNYLPSGFRHLLQPTTRWMRKLGLLPD